MEGPEYTETVGGTISAHPMLIQIAKDALKKKEHLVTIAFSAFAWEAALNVLGEGTVDGWNDHFERKLSPKGKLVLIAQKTGIDDRIHWHEEPWTNIVRLISIRNNIAHPKAATRNETRTRRMKVTKNGLCGGPAMEFAKPQIQIDATLGNATKSFDAVKSAIRFLNENLEHKHRRFLQNVAGYSLNFGSGLVLGGGQDKPKGE